MKNIVVYLIGGAATIGLVVLGFFLLNKQGNNPNQKAVGSEETILFYGDTCPHCLIVNDYLEENKVAEKFSFQHLEVYRNQDNSRLLAERAVRCGIKETEIGVPLLWSEGRCLVGDQDIIDFFKQKIGG